MILYHGTINVFDRFKPMSYFAEQLALALTFAKFKAEGWHGSDDPPRVIQCKIAASDVLEITADQVAAFHGVPKTEWNNLPKGCDWDDVDRTVAGLLRMSGAPVAKMVGFKDSAPDDAPLLEYPQYVVADPSCITMLNEYIHA